MTTSRILQAITSLAFVLTSMTATAHDMATNNLRVAVLLFEGVEEIDYAGPIQVFGASGAKVFTVGQTKAQVESVWGLKVVPDYDFTDAPEADILVVPGGGVKDAWKNPVLLAWIKQRGVQVKTVMAVCSGAFILGKAGMLDGIESTTTSSLRPQLAAMFPATRLREQRFVDTGKIMTTAGLSAGIDGALHLIERQSGKQQAQAVAEYMEYDWRPAAR